MRDRILVVGGGIGGLTLGAALRGHGFAPDIVEITPEWAPVGAGIILGINAMGIYRKLNLDRSLMDLGRQIFNGHITNAKGDSLSTMNFGQLNDRHGPSVAIHRADLHSVLVNANPGVRLGTSVSEIERSGDELDVEFSDGSRATYDLVVGADGIHSVTRELLFGRVEDRYSGYTCWRMIVELDDPPTDMTEMWGAGRRFGIVPLSGKKVYCFSTFNCPADDPQWQNISLEAYRSLFASFGGDVPRILGALESGGELIQNDLMEICIPEWTRGSVGLLGDAAHAMTPNMGQGAAMAIEDAWVLGEEIQRYGATSDALAAFEQRRTSRVQRIQQRSRMIGRMGQVAQPTGCFLRNQVLRWTPDRVAAEGLESLLTEAI